MEKVKVTQAQADLIKSIKDTDYAINIHGLNKRPDSPLQELTTAELARALYIGYEVEPEFEVGELSIVKNDELNLVRKILKIYEIDGKPHADLESADEIPLYLLSKLSPERQAQEKERRWWKKHGREVWELKKYDKIKHKNTGKEYDVIEVIDRYHFRVFDLREVCTSGFFFEDVSDLKERFDVVCFAEDRKDVEHAE